MRSVTAILCSSLFILTSCVSTTAELPVETEPAVHTARLVFIGDVMSHAPQVAAARSERRQRVGGDVDGAGDEYDYSEVFRHVRPVFEAADLVVANLETTLRTDPPYTGYPSFAAPAELAFAMREAGVDVAMVANNHICDKGTKGIRSTLALLDSAALAHTGAFLDSTDRRMRTPLYRDVNGLRFALLNYTYGTNGLPVPRGMFVNRIDTVLIAADLATIRRDSVDCVIVSYHWGEEYRSQPTRAQRELAAWTRAKGADIVIGGHPHVIEPFEAHYGTVTPAAPFVFSATDAFDAPVDSPSAFRPDSSAVVGATYYSLGNFVSNQRRRYTDGGMIAEITVSKTGSLPPDYDLGYRLVWVHTPWRDGVRRYEVLPTAVADTMHAVDPVRRQYERFLHDSRKLLSAVDSVFTEFK